ncbi:hypothetical protein [Campylobacter pinnipediorum]|uniref:hypothetical protein n=1 Tax=Campylobacter pinnipediorum TaxID=1965231 RepID=UPI00084D9192|nr:hypothetical protein [Campylobacter pinnipediorum]
MKNNKILFAFASILLLSVLDLSAERVTANYYKEGSGRNFSQFKNKFNRERSDGKGIYWSVSTKVKVPISKNSRCYDEQYSEIRTENGPDGNYKDRAISFDYWSGYYPPDKKIWDYGCAKDSYFRFPFPMLVEFDKGNTYSSNGLYKWTSVWDGYIDIPKGDKYSGDWSFSVTLQGRALLTICKPGEKDDCVYSPNVIEKSYNSQNKKKAYGYNNEEAIIFHDLKGGDRLRFRLIHENADWSIRKTSSIHFKWIKNSDINKNKGQCITPKLEPLKLGTLDTTIFREDGKCGMQIVNFNYKPKSDIEYRVVEDEYVDAYVNKDSGKDFDWLWNSPIRTKDIGDTNKFCIIMGTKDSSGKYVEIKENQSKIVGARIRYKDYQDKDTMRTLVNDKSEYMVRTPGSSKDMNKSKSCFRMTTVSEKLITKDAYFQVFEFTKNANGEAIVPNKFKMKGTGTVDSDHFSFKPIGYALSFTENGSGNKIEPTENDKKLSNITNSVLYLTSGKTYTVTAKAQRKDLENLAIKDITQYNSTEKSGDVTTVVGKYYTQIEDNDSLLIPYVNGKTCKDNVKNLPDGKFKIDFSDNVSNNFIKNLGYDNVMRFKTNIVDKKWTAIDQTNDQNKISKYGYECKEPSKQIKGVNAVELFNRDLVDCYISKVVPAYVEFVPDKFDVSMKSVDNFKGGDFTYINSLKDAYRMKAFLDIELTPKNAQDKIVSNFTKDCYAKDIGAVVSYDGDKILKENKPENHSLIEDKKQWSWKNLNNAKRMKFAENGGQVVINMYNSEFDPNLYFSGVYSKYDPSSLVASAPYLFSKDLFEQNTAIAKIGFNFDKDYKKPENPFVIYNKEFSLDKLKIGDRVITDSGRKAEFKEIATLQKNDITTKNGYATMVYGRVTAPYQEGPKDGFNGKIYYTFYCDVDCSSMISSRLKGDAIGNYVVNLSHSSDKFGHWDSYSTDDFGVWDDYSSMLKTNLASIPENNSFGAPSRVKNGVENVVFSNEKSVKDTIKLKMSKAPWLIFNENYPTYDYNEIKVGFFGANGNWAGKSYDGKGEDKNNAGKFILDELPNDVNVPVRKNRRIDW